MQKYAAVLEYESEYLFAALQHKKIGVEIEAILSASLEYLAENYRDYPLVLGVDEKHLETQSAFFPAETSETAIYQSLLKKHSDTYLDFEYLNKDLNELCVISYSLKKEVGQALKDPFESLGFSFCALEPIALAQKKSLEHPWQKMAMERFHFPQHEQALLLKLLDQTHFYGD